MAPNVMKLCDLLVVNGSTWNGNRDVRISASLLAR